MKNKYLFLIMLAFPINIFGKEIMYSNKEEMQPFNITNFNDATDQDNVYIEYLQHAKGVKELLDVTISNFINKPIDHELTISTVDVLNTIYNKCIDYNPATMHNPNNHYSVELSRLIEDTKIKSKAFITLLNPIVGINEIGVDGSVMENIVEPLLINGGWNKRNISVVCNDAYFCEYEFNGFKMMFIKSTRPKSTDYQYYTISVDFTYANGGGGEYAVGGNLYRLIQFKDNTNPKYYKVVKASSKRQN